MGDEAKPDWENLIDWIQGVVTQSTGEFIDDKEVIEIIKGVREYVGESE